MFYELFLLRRQNEGRFAMAWAAATRGIAPSIRQFGMKKIHELNIILLCEETMEYLQSSSNDPRKRLSLRMTLFLIRGTILLFNKQVSVFQDELVHFFSKITVPEQIISPPRDAAPTQRDFLTPPTPVIKEKRRRKPATKKADESLALEDFLRLGEEQEVSTALKQPIDADERRRTLQLVEEQPLLHVGVTDDLFGDLGVVPIEFAPVEVPQVPEKPPSEEGSVKSQLERIEELLVAEEQRKAEEKVVKEPLKSSKRKKRSSSIEGSPKVIQVVAMVHREAGPEEIGGRDVEATPPEKIACTEQSEIMEEISIVPGPKRTEITEEPKIIEEMQIVEEAVERDPILIREKAILKQIQSDKLSEHHIRESDENRKKKEGLTAKYFRIKFKKPKRFLHLDDYDKMYSLKEEFPIDIYNEERILDVNLMDAVMRKFSRIDFIGPPEMIRREEISSSLGSAVIRRSSKLTPLLSTPRDTNIRSTPQFLTEPSKIPVTSDFMERLVVETIVQSTPFREDVVMPQKKLYDETRIENEALIPEQLERKKEKFAPESLVQQIISTEAVLKPADAPHIDDERRRELEEAEIEDYSIIEPFVRKMKHSDEQQARRNIIIKIVKQWDRTQGDLIYDHLIPTPKNRVNAALTFGDLLALAKDGYVYLLPEENSISLKNIEKGRLLQ